MGLEHPSMMAREVDPKANSVNVVVEVVVEEQVVEKEAVVPRRVGPPPKDEKKWRVGSHLVHGWLCRRMKSGRFHWRT